MHQYEQFLNHCRLYTEGIKLSPSQPFNIHGRHATLFPWRSGAVTYDNINSAFRDAIMSIYIIRDL